MSNSRIKVLKLIKIILIFLLALYLLTCLSLYFLQDKLIFPIRKQSYKEIQSTSLEVSNIEKIELTMNDGCKIRGYFLNNSENEKSNLLIYFGANAEEASQLITKMSLIEDWSVALINYRGYGLSEGVPTEKDLFSDSLEIFDYLSAREDINKSNIVVMGRSIGTGVTTFLASKRDTSAVILTSPFDTLSNVVKKKCPILPVDLLLKHKFDSISLASSIKSPVLVLVGSDDKLIPVWHSKEMASAWGGKVLFKELPGVGHNTIDDGDEYWNNIREFLTNQDSFIKLK